MYTKQIAKIEAEIEKRLKDSKNKKYPEATRIVWHLTAIGMGQALNILKSKP